MDPHFAGLRDSAGLEAPALKALDTALAIASFSRSGEAASANEKFCRGLGYSAEEIVGKPHAMVVDAGGEKGELQNLWERLLNGETLQRECVALKKDGARVRMQARYCPLRDASGSVTLILLVATQLVPEAPLEKDREARLRGELERRMAVTPAMLHSLDERGRLIFVSDAWLAKLGYSREDVLGRSSFDFLTSESREIAINKLAPEYLRTGSFENVHYQIRKRDGEVIDALVSGVQTDDPFGRGRITIAVSVDVTEHLEAKRMLAASEARYRNLVEDQTDLVALTSPDGVLAFVNQAYATFCGRKAEEMVGRNLLDFVPEEEHAGLAEHFRQVRLTKEAVEVENQVVLRNGETRWFAWSNRALTDADGNVVAIHSVGRDIQRRVEAERRLQLSEARYRFLADNSSDLILLVGDDGKRLYASPASRKLLGYEPHEMTALRLRDSIHPDDAPRVFAVLDDNPKDTTLSYRMRRKDGAYVWVETTGKTVEIASNEVQRLVIVRDIEQRVAAEQRLKASEARYRLLADNSTDMVFQLDHGLIRRYVSPACREILGFEAHEMIGEEAQGVIHPEDEARLRLAYESLMSGHADRLPVISRMLHKDGRWIWVESQLRALKDPQTNKPVGVIGALRDITFRKLIEDELAAANQRLKALAGQDALTGLANRRSFDEALTREFRRAEREDRTLALIQIDVDRFKAFNDLYGHPAGDDCLRRVGEAISKSARRAGDVAARVGGEEFAVLLPDANAAVAHAIASRLVQDVLRLAIEHKGADAGFVTISIGVAAIEHRQSDDTQEALVLEADRALYQAKKNGRNRVVLASHVAEPHGPSAAA